ncbi:CHASE2 domain-containing protein [Dyella subtropica]|uniref:CHASE2 domain-containing protein n=1 Tax=Dyella subtropica TaxID=2992127 RepID=UPI00224F6B8E|nr:CHASE2 domain-containing protein [Dyella subtropica]
MLSRVVLRRMRRASLARVAFLVAMLVLAALSWHPMGASMSGAFDKVLFDLTARFIRHPSSGQVAVVNIDAAALREFGVEGLARQSGRLIEQLDQAASVALEFTMVPKTHASELAAAIARNGRVVLPLSMGAVDEQVDVFPPEVSTQAAGRGQRHVTVGHYGVVTGFVPYLASGRNSYPHLVMEAIRVADVRTAHESMHRHLRSDALSLAEARKDAVLVMLRQPGQIAQYAYADVVSGRIPAEAFANKIVFVGQSIWEDGGFQISSLNMDAASRAQLDALIADAVLTGNMASELHGTAAIPIYLALALGMMLICMLIPGRWMHLCALGWFVLMFALPALLLIGIRQWLGLGLLPLICVLIYAFFAWEHLRETLRLMRREIDKLSSISSVIGNTRVGRPLRPRAVEGADPVGEIRVAMGEIRALQSMFVNMLNQMPHSVFLAIDGRISVWNAKAAEVMDASSSTSVAQMQELIAEHCRGNEADHREVMLDSRAHMLLFAPYAGFDTSLHPAAESHSSYLVCLIDIASLKEGVAWDKLALRHIAHDLRGPLSTIMALIEERAGAEPHEALHNDQVFLDDLRQQADYSLRVAQDFLQLSRA